MRARGWVSGERTRVYKGLTRGVRQSVTMEDLIRRVSALEKRVEHRQTDDDTCAYEAQIRVLREDFTKERTDRVRMKERADSLQTMLDSLKREYNELSRKYWAMKNNSAKKLSRFYEKDTDEEMSQECCC